MSQGKLHAVWALESVPLTFSGSLYLAGAAGPWRAQAIELLRRAGFDGVVFVPEVVRKQSATNGTDGPSASEPSEHSLQQWEEDALRHSDLVLFWLGDGGGQDVATAQLWGQWQRSNRMVVGAPPEVSSPLVRSANRLRLPLAPTLAETVAQGLAHLRPGAQRRGGERAVPLMLWRSPGFQSWYRSLKRAGHRLDDAQLEWSYRSKATGRPPLLWAIKPRVFLPSERRHKASEVVIGRTDVSATVLYHHPHKTHSDGTMRPAERDQTLIALVREFRSATRNGSGYGLMIPGGSSAQASEREQDARSTALKEVAEETGLRLNPAQLQAVPTGDRQLLTSLSSHHAFLFRAELSDAQLQELRITETNGRPNGANPNERCYVTLRPLGELQRDPDLDWSQLGMLLHALADLS